MSCTFLRIQIFVYLLAICIHASVLDQLPLDYLPAGRPTYLANPVKYNESRETCGMIPFGSNSSDSYCNSTVLQEIENLVQGLSSNATEKLRSSLTLLRDSFTGLGNLLWRRLGGDQKNLDAMKLALEKMLYDYRTQQQAIGKAVVHCVNTLHQVIAGFLCAACNGTRYSSYVRPATQPVIHLTSGTIAAIEKNCTSALTLISGAVDSYNKMKMQLVDLLTAEMGSQTHLCTCSGTAVNYTSTLTYNVTKSKRELQNNIYVINELGWDSFANETSMNAPDVEAAAREMAPEVVQPFYVNRSQPVSDSKEVEELAKLILNSTGIWSIKSNKVKAFRQAYLTNFTKLIFAVGRAFNRTIRARSFLPLSQELSELVDVSSFSFDEIREGIRSFSASLTAISRNAKQAALLYKLWAKLLIDFLFRLPPSAYYIGFPAPNKTAFIVAKYAAELLKLFATFDYEQLSVSNVNLPYLSLESTSYTAMTAFKQCCPSSPCNIESFAICEKNLASEKRNTAIYVPIFRMMNRVSKNLTFFADALANAVLSNETEWLLDSTYRNYYMMKYFPPFYYVINAQERKLPSSADAMRAENFYNNFLLRSLIEIYEDCLGYVNEVPKNTELLKEIMRAEKDVGRSDQQLRLYQKLEPDELQKLKTYEMNKRDISSTRMCYTEASCKVGFIGSEQKVIEILLPQKTSLTVDIALMAERLARGYIGMTSLNEFMPYDDEQNLALSKCSNTFSARTLLCLQPVERDVLNMPRFYTPPDYSMLRGAELATLAFSRTKYLELLSFITKNTSATGEIPNGEAKIPWAPVIVVDDVRGFNLTEPTGTNYTVNETALPLNFEFKKILPDDAASAYASAYCSLSAILIILTCLFLLL